MTQDIQTTVQFTRGMMQYGQMNSYIVPVLDFPFEGALDILLQMRNILNYESNSEEPKPVYLPKTTLLNDLLRFFVPTIAQPFIINREKDFTVLPLSQKHFYPMPAIGIPRLKQEPNAQQEPLSASLLKQIAIFWIENTIENDYFNEQEMMEQRVNQAVEKAKEEVKNAPVSWRYVNLQSLWYEDSSNDGLGYRAIQTLVAVQFVNNSKQEPTQLRKDEVKWRLAQEGTHLIPVSQWFLDDKTSEAYAYTIEIELRDMPGYDKTQLYITPRLRRYMSKKTEEGDDAIRVMVELPTPLAETLPNTQLTVQVPLRIKKLPPKWELAYQGHIVGMLQKLLGDNKEAKIVSVNDLLKNPSTYLNSQPEWHNASYHVIYNTGMKPNHQLSPGLPDEYMRIITADIRTNLEEWFSIESPHPIDEPTLISRTINKVNDQFYTMSMKEIRDKGIWLGKSVKKRKTWITDIQKQFSISIDERPLKVFLIADNPYALQTMEFDVRSVLGLFDEELPKEFAIEGIVAPNLLFDLIEGNAKDDAKSVYKWLRKENLAQQSTDTVCVAIIQRPKEPKKSDEIKRDNMKKSSLRLAFSRAFIRTQMIRRFPDDKDRGLHLRSAKKAKQPLFTQERSRLINAISDALITGNGVSYGTPAEIYSELLGFDRKVAEQIIVEYWVRIQVRKPKIDYIAIARQYANTGYIEIIFPDPDTGQPLNPMSVHDAYIYVQHLFANNEEDARVYSYYEDNPKQYVFTFFQSQLTKREQPTLIVPQVGDWRSGKTNWFHDTQFTNRLNTVTIGDVTKSSEELENVRIVKMLTDEKYNMRYWLNDKQARHKDALLAIPDTNCGVPTLYSVDMSSTSDTDEMDIEDEYKRGRTIEFACVFSQLDDKGNELQWCKIPHVARIHPGWSNAKSIYPYPYHIVKKIVEDARWVIVR